MFLIDPLKIILKPPLSGCEVEHACKDNHSICNIIRVFLSRMLNIFTFSISKSYFINFNIPLYNPPNIKTSIILRGSLRNINYKKYKKKTWIYRYKKKNIKFYNYFLWFFIFWNCYMIFSLSILRVIFISMYTTKQSFIH